MRTKFFVVLLGVSVVAILIILSYKENGAIKYPVYKVSTMRGIHLQHREGDKLMWELSAESATYPEESDEIVLKDLKMGIHQKHEITLTGGGGIYNIQEKKLSVNKPIRIDIEGTMLTTNSLIWNGSKELITTDEDIRFEGKNFLIEGTGLAAEIKNQQIRILKNVKGVFYR